MVTLVKLLIDLQIKFKMNSYVLLPDTTAKYKCWIFCELFKVAILYIYAFCVWSIGSPVIIMSILYLKQKYFR